MDNKTVQYKRTLRGSVGAGMSAIFNGNGRRYYILEHKEASKYHKAGESQKIIVDQIEIGRDGNCQVRFDESFSTVSRRHAAIIKDGDRWKLVQLSKTNSTFLNGRPVDTEWYLQNGDEIQLSIGGPKMGFIVPAGKQSLVSSIKMTERLELFRKQALRPYKTAIVALFATLVVLSCGAGYVIHTQELDIKDLLAKAENQAALFAEARKKWTTDSTALAKDIEKAKASKKTVIVRPKDTDVANALDKVKGSVFALKTVVYIAIGDEKEKLNEYWGTGFLLNDGRFVTARHCVEPWMFDTGKMQAYYALQQMTGEVKIYTKIYAFNKAGDFAVLNSDNFIVDRSFDTPFEFPFEVGGVTNTLQGALAFGNKASLGNDWAYCRVNKKGSIIDGRGISDKLKSGTTVHLLGFPKGIGIGDGGANKYVDPIYNTMTISRDGLNDSRCIMVSQGVDHGNSGGPVFVLQNGKLSVIGIVSRGDHNSKLYNHLIPMSNLK